MPWRLATVTPSITSPVPTSAPGLREDPAGGGAGEADVGDRAGVVDVGEREEVGQHVAVDRLPRGGDDLGPRGRIRLDGPGGKAGHDKNQCGRMRGDRKPMCFSDFPEARGLSDLRRRQHSVRNRGVKTGSNKKSAYVELGKLPGGGPRVDCRAASRSGERAPEARDPILNRLTAFLPLAYDRPATRLYRPR